MIFCEGDISMQNLKRSAREKELDIIRKKECSWLKSKEKQSDSFLNQKLEQYVPEKLQNTLNVAFEKAFTLIFDKGAGVIEKTYKKEELERIYKINAYAMSLKEDKKSLRTFSRLSGSTGVTNLLLSGAEGVGLGILGIGLPDIPLFTAMMLKSVYQTALTYGFDYESEEERYFILKLIETSLLTGNYAKEADMEVNYFIQYSTLPKNYDRKEQIRKTAQVLSNELLYMKFLQGIPVVGAIGGAYDAVYLKRIIQYANLKYRKRFLSGKDL